MSEQFRVPRVNVIESSDRFTVEVLGRTGLLADVIDRVTSWVPRAWPRR
jgi:hypothetical protein